MSWTQVNQDADVLVNSERFVIHWSLRSFATSVLGHFGPENEGRSDRGPKWQGTEVDVHFGPQDRNAHPLRSFGTEVTNESQTVPNLPTRQQRGINVGKESCSG